MKTRVQEFFDILNAVPPDTSAYHFEFVYQRGFDFPLTFQDMLYAQQRANAGPVLPSMYRGIVLQ